MILWLCERKIKEGKGFILIPPKIAFYCVTKQVACLRSLWVSKRIMIAVFPFLFASIPTACE